jgi:hypothetical protein
VFGGAFEGGGVVEDTGKGLVNFVHPVAKSDFRSKKGEEALRSR